MRRIRSFTLAAILGAASIVPAMAGPINGSLPFSDFNATQNGAIISASTLFSDTDTLTSGTGVGDFGIVPLATDYGPFTLDLSMIATGGGVTISNAAFGSFSATSGEIVTQNDNFLDVYLLGTYTPGPAFDPSITADAASFRLQFNQSGASLSGAATLSAPPAGVPEPASALLIGLGLCGVARLRRFSKRSAH